MGESALTGQLGAPLRGAPSCYAKVSSPPPVRLGHRQAARLTTYTELLRLSRLPCTRKSAQSSEFGESRNAGRFVGGCGTCAKQ
eukprot:14838987-Alexandrium_andersonii.AAC.1